MRALSSTNINFFPGSVTYHVDLVDGIYTLPWQALFS